MYTKLPSPVLISAGLPEPDVVVMNIALPPPAPKPLTLLSTLPLRVMDESPLPPVLEANEMDPPPLNNEVLADKA